MQSKTKKNEKIFNKTIKALIKYNALNNLRDQALNDDDMKLYKKADRQCETAWHKYWENFTELPQYEQKRIESSDLYLN